MMPDKLPDGRISTARSMAECDPDRFVGFGLYGRDVVAIAEETERRRDGLAQLALATDMHADTLERWHCRSLEGKLINDPARHAPECVICQVIVALRGNAKFARKRAGETLAVLSASDDEEAPGYGGTD